VQTFEHEGRAGTVANETLDAGTILGIGGQLGGLARLDVAVGLAEHAVEDDEVVERVDVTGRPEAMKEADGSELGVRRRSAAKRGSRALQEGLMPRPLHENGVSRSWPQSWQRALANPWARMPHSK
jgi:hypothetical protein